MAQQTSAVAPALKPGTKYYWKVGMFYKKANKQYTKQSSTYSFRTVPYVIETAPADGTVSTERTLRLSWNEVPNVKYYYVDSIRDNDTKNPIRRSSSQNYYDYATVKKGVSYSWRVRAVDKNGALIGVSDWKTFSS